MERNFRPAMYYFSWKDLAAMVPKPVKIVEALFMIGALIYQGNLIYQVARDFIAPGNLPLIFGFTVMVVILIGGIDFLVIIGVINVLYRSTWTALLLGAVTIVLIPVFIFEIGRLNVAQNGIPLASIVVADFTKSIDQGIQKIEEAMAAKSDQWINTLALLDAAVDAESQGLVRTDVERDLRALGVNFQFSGKVGTSTFFRTTQNIRLQKEREFLGFEENLIAERAVLNRVREAVAQMASTKLTPENYPLFVSEQVVIASQLKELAARYSVSVSDFEIKPAESLFVIAVKSAFTLNTTSLILWWLALGTTLGVIIVSLFINAAIISYELARIDQGMEQTVNSDFSSQFIQREIENRIAQSREQLERANSLVANAHKEADRIIEGAHQQEQTILDAANKRRFMRA